MVTFHLRRMALALVLLISARGASMPYSAMAQDELDLGPFDFDPKGLSESAVDSKTPDDAKSIDTLMREAKILSLDKRYLDARSKWLKVLEKDPKDYKAMVELGAYYLVQVGHFRLALKYLLQAQAVLEEKSGKPPYSKYADQIMHAGLLYLISQARLNLDNYQGALDTLDSYTKFGYYADWYPGSRAWILMKMGKIQEAIRVARLGYLALSDPREKGQILNMLGILLSMDGQRDASLQIFKEAIKFEYSEGDAGQPATPLNNSGEVYNEIFEEDKAENSWLKATGLKDGCDHVLPSLNLSLLYLGQINPDGATKAMDNFESCVAQFPLRNGEEHRALVHLARGRIDLLNGRIESAVAHLEAALSGQQWFGKIGTDVEDLQAGASISLAVALRAQVQKINATQFDSLTEWFNAQRVKRLAGLRSWWLLRRTRQLMAEDLVDLEDITIRNTDSLIEYATFGSFLVDYPIDLLKKKVESLRASENRTLSWTYYRAYLAESSLRNGEFEQGLAMLKELLPTLRRKYDDRLKLHLLLLQLEFYSPESSDYVVHAHQIYALSRSALRNAGLRLPVQYKSTNGSCADALTHGPFLARTDLPRTEALEYSVSCRYSGPAGGFMFEFASKSDAGLKRSAQGATIAEALNKLSDAVFSVETDQDHRSKL